MEDQDSEAKAQTETAERAQRVQDAVAHAISADLGRMVRSDVTRLTEMIAKYAGLPGSFDALEALVGARERLLEFSAETAGMTAPSLAGPGVDSSPMTETGARASAEPWDTPAPMKGAMKNLHTASAGQAHVFDAGGKDVLLTEVLVRQGFVSSSGRAKVGIREGVVRVNGEPITHAGALLSPGEYTIGVGDGDDQQVVVQ
jgi:ribosome-associated protein YbcJ (S4-like RNA binding protein)